MLSHTRGTCIYLHTLGTGVSLGPHAGQSLHNIMQKQVTEGCLNSVGDLTLVQRHLDRPKTGIGIVQRMRVSERGGLVFWCE